MKAGELFKPIDLRRATKGLVFPPAIVGRRRDLQDGVKRLYHCLYSRAQNNNRGICWPSFRLLAEELGKSIRTIKSDMKELERLGLVSHKRRGARQSNIYSFLWHGMLDVQATAPLNQEVDEEPSGNSEPEVQ